MAARISVVLSVYDTGFEDEAEWDAWTGFVDAHLDEVLGEPAEVAARSWRSRGSDAGPDAIRIAPEVGWTLRDALTERTRDAILTLWDRFCSEVALPSK